MLPVASLDPPQEGIRLEKQHTLLYIRGVCEGIGTLYVTEDNITWINDCNEGLLLKYPDISIFAVCTDLEKYPECCVYILARDDDATESTEYDSGESEEHINEIEIRFAPPEGTDVHILFNCIQECNRLHPTPGEDSFSDDDSGNKGDSDLDDTYHEASEQEDTILFTSGNGDFTRHINGQFDDVD